MKYWRWLALAGSLCVLMPAQAVDKLVISTSVVAPYTTPDRAGFLDQLMFAVFREIGVAAEVLVYPSASERSLLNANEGVDDGQALRVAGLEKQYPNLIRVSEPVIVNDFVAMSAKHRFVTPTWDALKPYAVTYIIGWKVFEVNVPAGNERTLVREADQLFSLLAKGRAEVALYERWQGLALSQGMGMKVQAMEPPLLRTDMYMYLHKKHAVLVPRVAEALVKLKKNGTYQRIFDATLTPLAQ